MQLALGSGTPLKEMLESAFLTQVSCERCSAVGAVKTVTFPLIQHVVCVLVHSCSCCCAASAARLRPFCHQSAGFSRSAPQVVRNEAIRRHNLLEDAPGGKF